MSKILVINSSPRGERSVTRTLVTKFTQDWLGQNPEAKLVSRDLGHHPVPAVNEPWIAGAFTPPESWSPESKAAIAVSDELVDELLAADRYVFGVPMYNFSIPSTFKAYIDQIVRIGRTFSVGAEGYAGLVKNKKAIFVTSSGASYAPGTPFAPYNFQEPYLRAITGFLGITDVQFVVADSQSYEATAPQSVAKAEGALKDLASSW